MENLKPSNGCFKNIFDDYHPNTPNHVLNYNKDGISGKFQAKLQNYKTEKLDHLLNNMQEDIFQDGTVYTGSAGLTMYLLMCTMNMSKHESSRNMYKKALSYIDIDVLKGRRISFLCGDAGPLALATIISYKMGDKRPSSLPEYKDLVKRLIALISLLNDSPDELLYGKSGYLYALLFVNKYIDNQDAIPSYHIEKVIKSILRSGKEFAAKTKSSSKLLWQWHDKVYLGAAHGIAGILYILLQAQCYIKDDEMQNYIKPTLDWLLELQFSSGNFPSSLSSNSGDRLVQWCHGAPGFVPLLLLAHQIFGEHHYLEKALKCGEVVWQRGLCSKGYSICHGVSGNAYAFIQLYHATKNPSHLYRACCFMEWCAMERPGTQLHTPDRPASLFEGLLGRLYLLEDMINICNAKFPAFTI